MSSSSSSPRPSVTIGTDSRTVVSPQGKGSPVSAVKKTAASPYPVTPTGGNNNAQSGTWLSSWVCSPPPPAMPEPECREMTEISSSGSPRSTHPRTASGKKAPPPSPAVPAVSSIFTDMSNYVRRITSDPEYQFAGLI